MRNQMNVGLVADWLVTFAGSEKVIKEFINIFPDSELYSVVDFLSQSDRDLFLGKSATTTFIQRLPFAKSKYQKYLPLMPLAIEQLDVSKHNVILSSSHAVAKGILTGPDQLHISYVHSPIRYAWDLQHQYLREAREGANKQVISSQADSLIKISRIWADFFPANTSNQPI